MPPAIEAFRCRITLMEGDYSYSMTLYDVYGNCYYTQNVTFSYDENGDLYFDPDELA